MVRNTGDRRVRKTKALLRQGLTELMRRKDVKDITVTELTELVDVNRGTFYCHYKDIYDMVEKLEQEVFEEFIAVMDSYTAENLRAGLRPILRDIFSFIDRNADVCSAFMRAEGDNSFFRRLKEVVYDKVAREWGQVYGIKAAADGDYYLSFLVAGTVGMVQAWGRKEMREGSDEMAAMAERMILNGLAPMRAE